MRSASLRLRALLCASVALAACSRELSLPPPAADTGYLSGRAIAEIAGTDQGQPVQGAIASVPGTNLHSETDAQGLFVLGPLPSGTYRVLLTQRSQGAEPRQRLLDGVSLSRGATKAIGDVSLHRNAQVSGRALLDGNARGNAGVLVFVPGTEFATVTGDNGVYQLRGLPEGVVRVAALRQGFTPATTADMSVQGGVLTTAVDLVLPTVRAEPLSGAISGRVVLLGGGAATVSVFSRGNRTATATATALVATDGSFTLGALPQDLYRLHAEAAGIPPVDVPNLLVTSGAAVHLPDPLILAPLGIGNEPFDGGSSFDDGSDAGAPDAGAPDAGSSADAGHAQCGSDADCPGGQLCQDSVCVACARDSDCQSGFVCRQNACTRQCLQNPDCPAGEVCSGGTCGACVTSSDCRDSALVCLPGGLCGACRSGLDCPSGKACLATGCGACTADNQCGAGHLCESGLCVTGQCHDNSQCAASQTCQNRQCTTCQSDAQCSSGHLCLGAQCVPGDCRTKGDCAAADACLNNLCGACGSTADCGAGQVCDPALHACTAGNCNVGADCATAGQVCVGHSCSGCGTGVACPAGNVCSLGLCTPGNCLLAQDCPVAGEVCSNHSCGPCGKSADCGQSGLVCVSGSCTAGQCLVDGDCATGQLCNGSHQCVACSGNAQCNQGVNSGRVCAGGLCQTGTCAQPSDCVTSGVYNGKACIGLNCAACAGDVQCPAGRLCLGGACTLATCRTKLDCSAAQACVNNQCGACNSTADCGGAGVCDPALRQCVPGNCNTAADCTASGFTGEVCVNKVCTACGASVACAAGQVCASGACVTGNCTPQTGCANGQVCSNNSCVACGKNADCLASNLVCIAGACTPGNCAVASDCPTAGQLCSASHQCSACTADAQCPGGGTTPPSGVCVLGLCKTGNCHSLADCAAINGGFCSSSNSCIPCTQKTDCGASGYVCNAGTCTPGNCAQESDCAAGQLCSASHFCVACTGNAQCGTNRVCSSGLCQPGNCATTADCAAGFPGEVCSNLTCSLCTADSQCALGNICISGKCTAGNCHSAADCSGGKQLCNTTSHLCYGCDSTTLTGGCPAGDICDVNGLCQAGNCKQSADCQTTGAYNGQICQSYACGPCSAQTQAQCAPGFQLCSGSQCVAGNCLTNSDCTSVGQPFCDQSQHLCKACSISAQCGAPSSGKVCNTSTGACVAGQCGTDLACGGVGQTCDLTTFLCQQSAPAVVAQGAGENTSVSFNQDAMALSGIANLYYDVPISGGGLTAVALDPVTLKTRWRVTDSTSSVVAQNPGIVLPAPGFKGNELYVTVDGRGGGGNIVGHQAADGTPAWTVTGDNQMCAGLSGTPPLAVPTLAWSEGTTAHLMRADGTNARTLNLGSSPKVGCAFGTRYVYYLIQDGLYLVDPAANTLIKLLFTALPGNQYLGNTGPSVMSIYRPPGATQDVVIFGGNAITSSPGTPALYAAAVPDSGSPTFLFGTSYAVPTDSGTSPLIDSSGNIFVLEDSSYQKLSWVNQSGTLLGQAANPFDKSQILLAADGSCGAGITDCIVGYSGGNLKGVYFSGTASPKNQLTTAFTLSLSPQGGTFPLLGWPSVITAPLGSASGAMTFWAQATSAALPGLWSFAPASPRAGDFSQPAPAWPELGGDSGYHFKAPAYGCQKDVDCAAPTSCIFNQCVGSCQTPAACTPGSPNCTGGGACSAGLGCVLGQCGTCNGDAACGAGSRCSAGACYVAPATGSCSTTADCGSSAMSCVRATCVNRPAPSLTVTLTSSGSTNGGAFPFASIGATVGTDGTAYVVSRDINNQALLTAYDPALNVLFQKSLLVSFNVYTPPSAQVVSLGAPGSPDTLVYASDGSNHLLLITGTAGGAVVAATGTVVNLTLSAAATQNPMSFGYSKALDGSTVRPTGFYYTSGNLIGVDLLNAAAGATPFLVWSGVTSTSDVNVQAPSLVGSDGILYHLRNTGILEAWSEDGNLAGPAPTASSPRSGKLLWTYPPTGNLGWSSFYAAAAIAHNDLGGQLAAKSDVLYACAQVGSANVLQMIPVGPSGAGPIQSVASTLCGNQPILVDASGYALFGTSAGLASVSPQGQLLSSLPLNGDGIYAPTLTLADDNLVYLMSRAQGALSAVVVTPQHTLSLGWQSSTANNGNFDQQAFPLLVPGLAGGLGHILVDWASTTVNVRNLSSYPLSTAHGLAPGAWSTTGGDNQRRYSLKAP
jgi:hypothetical protein